MTISQRLTQVAAHLHNQACRGNVGTRMTSTAAGRDGTLILAPARSLLADGQANRMATVFDWE